MFPIQVDGTKIKTGNGKYSSSWNLLESNSKWREMTYSQYVQNDKHHRKMSTCPVSLFSTRKLTYSSTFFKLTAAVLIHHRIRPRWAIFPWGNRHEELDESFAPKAIHSVHDDFVGWNETNTQFDQFLGWVLCPDHPLLFVLLDSECEKKF